MVFFGSDLKVICYYMFSTQALIYKKLLSFLSTLQREIKLGYKWAPTVNSDEESSTNLTLGEYPINFWLMILKRSLIIGIETILAMIMFQLWNMKEPYRDHIHFLPSLRVLYPLTWLNWFDLQKNFVTIRI